MKKLTSLLTATILFAALTLTGCGKSAPEVEESTVAATEESSNTEVAAETNTESEAAPAAETSAEVQSVDGLITDAAMNSFTIQTQDGAYLFFSMPEEGADTQTSNGLLLGTVVNVTYTGSSDDGTAVATVIKDSSVTAALTPEDYQYLFSVIQTVQFMDMEGLSGLITYPAYIDLGDSDATVNSEADFTALDKEALLNEDLMVAVSNCNLFTLSESKVGIVLGDGTPNIIVSRAADGTLGITGINAAAK